MIVFDVAGTLLGGEEYDWRRLDNAFEEAAGFPKPKGYFPNLVEVTAQAIVHQLLSDEEPSRRKEIEQRTRHEFLERLRKVHAEDTRAFPAAEGAAELLSEIPSRGIPLAIATGAGRTASTSSSNPLGSVRKASPRPRPPSFTAAQASLPQRLNGPEEN